MSEPISFDYSLPKEGRRGTWCPIRLPEEVHAHLGGDRGRIPVVGDVDGHPIRTTASPMGGGHLFPFNKAMQKATGKGPGDDIRVTIARDEMPRTVELPDDFDQAIQAHPAAALAWGMLAPSHRREYVRWIEEAKRPETRQRRITKGVEMIAEGKRRK